MKAVPATSGGLMPEILAPRNAAQKRHMRKDSAGGTHPHLATLSTNASLRSTQNRRDSNADGRNQNVSRKGAKAQRDFLVFL
jgi:hypothetical protein